MKQLTLDTPFATVFETEISAISAYYGLPETAIQQTAKPLATYFEHYWEMVFSETSFELITAGTGTAFVEKISQAARQQGLSEETIALFRSCQQTFPDAICGLKFCFAADRQPEPTLYVRTKTNVPEVLTFLGQNHSILTVKLLQQALSHSKILYGLGFSEKQGQLYLKTYTIEAIKGENSTETTGFVSHRLWNGQVDREHKAYLPEVSLYSFAPEEAGLKKLQQFLLHEMNYATAGHLGMLYQNGKLTETKIYVERVGGIPTDFSAR